jgi:TolA-binding protein
MSQRFHRRTSLLNLIPVSVMALALALPTVALAGPPPPPPPGGATTPAAGPPAPPPAPPATAAPAGSPMAQGEAAYKAEDYEGAAIQFHKIASAEIPGDVPRAQFWLGKALYKLGFY